MKSLYLNSGYLNVEKILSYNMPFNFIVGGRGTGKTYGILQYYVKHRLQFLYMRRTDAIIKSISNNTLDPMAPIAKDNNFNLLNTVVQGTNGYLHGWFKQGEDGKLEGAAIGYSAALSVFGNMRGFDASQITDVCVDEFIREPQMPPISDDESYVFYNAVETINRNRELNGKAPVRCVLLANSEDLSNDYFVNLKIVDIADKMKQSGNEFYIDKKRGFTLWILSDSPISKAKQDTALYRLTEGTTFAGMSVGNDFVNNHHSTIKSRNLNNYYPLVAIGELCIYQSKQGGEDFYACLHKNGACRMFTPDKIGKQKFRAQYSELWNEYMYDNITFETYTSEALFQKMFVR